MSAAAWHGVAVVSAMVAIVGIAHQAARDAIEWAGARLERRALG